MHFIFGKKKNCILILFFQCTVRAHRCVRQYEHWSLTSLDPGNQMEYVTYLLDIFHFYYCKKNLQMTFGEEFASTKNIGGHIQNGPTIGLFHVLEPGSSATLVLVPAPSQFNLSTSQEPLRFSTSRLGSYVGRPLYTLSAFHATNNGGSCVSLLWRPLLICETF